MTQGADRTGRDGGWLKTLFSEWAWPVWIIGGVLGYLAIGHGLPVWLARAQDSLPHVFLIETGLYRPLAWWFLAGGVVGSVAAMVADLRRRSRLAVRMELERGERRDGAELEHWVGQAFRSRGYSVEARGLGDHQGGADMILRHRDGRRVLLQYQHWQREEVGALSVRELYGLMVHHRADAVQIVSLGGPTPEAALFARGKPIEFMGAGELLGMIRKVRSATTRPDGRTRDDQSSASA